MALREFTKWAGGIRGRLVVLALIATAPFIWTRMVDIRDAEANIIAGIREDVVQAAARGASDQVRLFAEVRTFLMALSKVPMLTYGSTADCSDFLISVKNTTAWSKNLAMTTPTGRIFCATDPAAIGIEVGARPYFQAAVRSRGFVVTRYMRSPLDGKPIVSGVFPVFTPGGKLVSVALATLNLNWLENVAAGLRSRVGTQVYLFDDSGKAIAQYPPATAIGTLAAEEARLSSAVVQRSNGWFEDRQEGGPTRVYGIADLVDAKARLAIGFSLDAALADSRAKLRQAYFNAVLAGAMIVLLAWLGGEVYLIGPLRGLLEATRKLTHGELDARVELKNAPPEFRELSASFNTMADQLSTLATVDSLTGVANRRRCDQYIEEEWQRGMRSGQPLAIALIDVDEFKRFNDQNGHQAGDDSLRLVAGALRRIVRRHVDLVGRFGGDEFVLCLPGLDGPAALAFCEALRARVEELAISSANERTRNVTVSIGVAAFVPSADSTAKELIAGADLALYEVKRSGRNKVSLFGAIPSEESSRVA